MLGGHGRRRNVTDRAKAAGVVDRWADGSDRHVLPIMISHSETGALLRPDRSDT
jgi:hypothetical protein